MRKIGVIVWLLVFLLGQGAGSRAGAQGGVTGRIDVFVGTDPETGLMRVYFLDALSGLSTVVNVEDGRHFALVGDYVIYEKTRTGAIMRANADGTLEPHPFIRRAVGIETIRWVAAPDGSAIAWVQVDANGVSAAFVARADGAGLRQLPLTAPGAGLVLFPLYVSAGMEWFLYDAAHPLQPPLATPFDFFAHVAAYSIAEERFVELPAEPDCPCGAAVSANGRIVARLEADAGEGPFALHVWDLPTGASIVVPRSRLPYPLAGNLVVNNRGTLAAYAVAAEQHYGVVLVDVVARQQRLALSSEEARYRPLAFIDRDTMVLLTDEIAGGTWKLDLTSGELVQVSDKLYLGTIEAR